MACRRSLCDGCVPVPRMEQLRCLLKRRSSSFHAILISRPCPGRNGGCESGRFQQEWLLFGRCTGRIPPWTCEARGSDDPSAFCVILFFWKRTVRNRGPDSKVNSSGARGSDAPPVLVSFCFDDFGRSNLCESGQSLTLSHIRLSRFVSAFVVVSCTWQHSASARHHVARSADVRHVLFHPYGDVKGFTSNRATTVVEHHRKNASWTVPSQSQSGPCRRVLIATREMASEWSCAWQRSASVSQYVERSTLSSETSGSLPSLFVCFLCSDDSAKTDL